MKKYLAILLSALLAAQTMAFGVFAAETKTELYKEDFNSSKEEVFKLVEDVSSVGSAIHASERSGNSQNGSRAVMIRRTSGKTGAAGRVKFFQNSDENSNKKFNVYNQTDKNLMIEVQFEGNVTKVAAINSSGNKDINVDYLLGTPEATDTAGLFGGIRMTSRALRNQGGVDPWKISFLAGDNSTVTELMTGSDSIANDDMATKMVTFVVQYVFRENGVDKNVARVRINGDPKGGDIPLGVTPDAETLSQVGSMVIHSYVDANNVDVFMDNITVNRIVSDDVVTEPEEPDPPTPDDDDDLTPDLEKRGAGYLARNAFEAGTAPGWGGDHDFMEDNKTDEIGKALLINGNPDRTINKTITFSPTALLSGSITDEGNDCAVFTDFDVYSKDLVANGETAEIQLGNTKSSDGTPTVTVMLDGVNKTITFSNAVTTYPLKDGEWYRIRIQHIATDSNGAQKKKYKAWVNETSFRNETTATLTPQTTKDGKADYYDKITVKLAKINSSVALDNLSVYRYNAAEGGNTGGAVDKNGLICLIRSASARLAEAEGNIGTAAGKYEQAKYDALVQAKADALTVYRDDEASSEGVTDAQAALKSAYDALVPIVPNIQISAPAFYQGDTNTPMTDLTEADVLRTQVNFTVGDDEPEISKALLVVGLYELNGQTPLLVQVASGTADLKKGEISSAVAELNLGGFELEERDNLVVNVMVWDGMGSLRPLVPCKAM